MQIRRIVTIPLIGVLVILGGCANPIANALPATVVPAQVPATVAPAQAPAPVAPASAPAPEGLLTVEHSLVVQVTPTQGQSGFIISQLQLSSQDVQQGDEVIIFIVVTNTGGQQGVYTVALKLDDDIIQTQNVTIDGGASSTVALNVITWFPCDIEYKVMAGKLTSTLRVYS